MDPRPLGTPAPVDRAALCEASAAFIQALSQSLTSTFTGLTAVTGEVVTGEAATEEGVLSLWAGGQLVSTLHIAELLGTAPDAEVTASVLWVVLSTVQDDLVRDWGSWGWNGGCPDHWPPALCAQVSAIAQAVPEVSISFTATGQPQWAWAYCLPHREAPEQWSQGAQRHQAGQVWPSPPARIGPLP